MKKHVKILGRILLVVLIAISCNDNNNDDLKVLSVFPMEVNLGWIAGSEATVTILTPLEYTFEVEEKDKEWLQVLVADGSMNLKALMHNRGDARTGNVHIRFKQKDGTTLRSVLVTQLEGERLPPPMPAEPYKWSNHSDKLYTPFLTDYSGTHNVSNPVFQQGKTRILPYLIGFEGDASLVRYKSVTNKYGSRTDKTKYPATGHFYTKKIDGRWFFIDPEGYLHHHHGITSVRKGSSARNNVAWMSKYGMDAQWIKSIQKEMADLGIHGSGAFSQNTYQLIQGHNMANVNDPLILCPSFSFLTAFRQEEGSSPGGVTANNPGLAFYDGWKDFCKRQIQKELALYKDDPNTIGFFSDNEIGFTDNNDDVYLAKRFLAISDPENPARKAVEAWMQDEGLTSPDQIYYAQNGRFAGRIADAYYKGIREALDELGIKTLYFGSRLHGNPKGIESVIKAAGKYCDVISINLYGYWDITNKNIPGENSRVYDWHQWTETPFIITEFYTRALESDLANNSGGGYLVRTFKDRAYVYQHITLGLLESPHCVGWTWFKYQDDDGNDNDGKPANKGLYDNYYNLYPWLSIYMKSINVNAFELIEYFDGKTY